MLPTHVRMTVAATTRSTATAVGVLMDTPEQTAKPVRGIRFAFTLTLYLGFFLNMYLDFFFFFFFFFLII